MSGPPLRPSRLTTWLLRLVSSRDAANAAVGDILEELEARTDRVVRWPRLWLEMQTLKFTLAALTSGAPRGLRAAGYCLRDAGRALRNKPAHALFVLLILGVGISAATVTFTVVDTVLFRPLLLDPDERLVNITLRDRMLSPDEAQAVCARVPTLDGCASFRVGQASATIDGLSANLYFATVEPEFFGLLRLNGQTGRLLTHEDAARGSDVAVISDDFWHRRFNADPTVIGRTIEFKDGPRRIVGVLTPDADAAFAEVSWQTEVLIPASDRFKYFSSFGGGLLARLRAEAAIESTEADTKAVLTPFTAAATPPNPAWNVNVRAFRSAYVRVQNVRSWMLMVLSAVALVVLIACINAANAMLTRSASRAHELAVRASLGASRKMLAGILLTESLILSTAATAMAVIFAALGLNAVKSVLPGIVPRVSAISLDRRIFTAAVLAALVTGLLFGTVPAWEASRASVVGLLKDGSTAATSGRRRWRTTFLVMQVSCVAVLLVLSTLFVGSFIRVVTTDLGLNRSNLIAAATVTDFMGTVDELSAQLARIPGITSVASVTNSSPPLIGSAFGGAWDASTLSLADGSSSGTVKTEIFHVSSNYFDVTGTTLRRGSTWSRPPAGDWNPIVIDQEVARALFGSQDPLGRTLRGTELVGAFTVVGVAPFAYTHGPEGRTSPSAYVAIVNARPSFASFFLRTAGPPQPMVHTVEAALATLSKPNTSTGSGVRVVDDAFRRLTATRRFTGTLMGLFAIIEMIIGAAGIYAVTSSVVAQQTREFGVRVALGATAADIHRGVLGQATRHVLAGLAIGLPVAWWISRGFGSLFFKVQPSDVSVYLVVATLLLSAGLLAALLPARRAARVDPIVSLRAS